MKGYITSTDQCDHLNFLSLGIPVTVIELLWPKEAVLPLVRGVGPNDQNT